MNKKISQFQTSNTILGKDSEFEGDMKFFGTLLIKGVFKGNVAGEGVVTIEQDAIVASNIHASVIKIHGKIFGQVSAENKVHIHDTGQVFGDIEAPDIVIEKGALVKGKCHTHQINMPGEEEQAITRVNTKDIIHKRFSFF